MNVSQRNTKAELLAHITKLEERLAQGGRDMADLRHKLSVAQGTIALKEPAPNPKRVRINGLWHDVVVEQTGQCTRKRFTLVPGQGV